MNKIKVLYVLGGEMVRRGVEVYVMNVLRSIDHNKYEFSLLFHSDKAGVFEQELTDLGCKLYFLNETKKISQKISKYKLYYAFLVDKNFDVVHSQLSVSGSLMKAAKKANIPVRIAHSHNDFRNVKISLLKKLYYKYNLLLDYKYMTRALVVSPEAGLSYFGDKWELDPRIEVLYCGLNWDNYDILHKYAKDKYDIPEESFLVSQVGTFTEQKNQEFSIKVLKEIVSRNIDNVYFLFAGDGYQLQMIKDMALRLGVYENCRFLGSIPDIPNLLSTTQLFLFPSTFEGLGLAVVEAQAAGLLCLVSDKVPQKAEVYKPAVSWLSLEQPVSKWADKVIELLKNSAIDQGLALAAVRNSTFNITNTINRLNLIYSTQDTPLSNK